MVELWVRPSVIVGIDTTVWAAWHWTLIGTVQESFLKWFVHYISTDI